jgi:SAM-dependent methyltransferase
MSNLYTSNKKGRSPAYLYTNESLDAIVKGLDVNERDDILAVCGSGDQAFAMLEYANSVVAVDIKEDSVKYAKYRLEALKAGDISEFLKPCRFCDINCSIPFDKEKSNIYFRKGNRLERIMEKAGKLKIVHKSIYEVNNLGRFSKGYFSNALGYNPSKAEIRHAERFLKELAQKIKMPGLAYIVTRHIIYPSYSLKNEFLNDTDDAIRWPAGLCIDKTLTSEAVALEKSYFHWVPLVLRRKP